MLRTCVMSVVDASGDWCGDICGFDRADCERRAREIYGPNARVVEWIGY